MKPFWKKSKPTEISAPEPAAEQQLPLKSELQPEPSIEVPKKPEPQRKRSERLTLRLSEDEFNYITEQAQLSGQSKTDYIMSSVHNNPVIGKTELPELLLELRRQGNNLNQLTRLAHKTGSVELPKIEEILQQCELAQAAIIEICANQNSRAK